MNENITDIHTNLNTRITRYVQVPMMLTELAKQVGKDVGVDFIPRRAHDTDAAVDIRACIESPIYIPSRTGEPIDVPTGIMIDLNHAGKYLEEEVLAAKLIVRSGTKGLNLWNQTGLVDQGYRGEIILKLINKSWVDIVVQPGERIAQMTVEKVLAVTFYTVPEFEGITERGTGGFNSSGTK